MRNDKDNIIVNKTIEFSIAIINYCGLLEQHRRFVISKQLLRSATSIGANVFEAQNAESKADFIHKIKLQPKKQVKLYTGLFYAKEVKGIFSIQN